jgi:trimethylamine--corrinoid protein Co-methyltransferase
MVENGYRPSTAQDLYDAARLAHALDNIHFFQRTMVCREIADNVEMDLNTLYACSRAPRNMSARPSRTRPSVEPGAWR